MPRKHGDTFGPDDTILDVTEVSKQDMHWMGLDEESEGKLNTELPSFSIEHVNLAADIDRLVALVTLKIADLCIHRVAIWRSLHGRLRVHFPSYNAGWSWDEAIELPPELRSEVEAEVIAAYKTAKAQAKKEEKNK